MASRYCDFDLQISPVPGKRVKTRFQAQVTRSPAGSSDPVEIRWPYRESCELVLLRVENAILLGTGSGRRGHAATPQEKILREFGTDMFNAVFRKTPEIAACFDDSLKLVRGSDEFEGMRVKLKILNSRELAGLPWEYIFDEQPQEKGGLNYVCLKRLSPVMRFFDRDRVQEQERDAVEGRLNILGMICNPGGEWEPLDVEAERRTIEKAIGGLSPRLRARVNFRWVKGSTPDDLMVELQKSDWHVFHFIGHGAVSDDGGPEGSESSLVFMDAQGRPNPVSPDVLNNILQGGRTLRLAVLNCCDSARGTSPGAALVQLGVPAVVAMQFPIPDEAAVQFSKMFYASLANGLSVEQALTDTRVSMQAANYRVEWGIPVLFTRGGSNILLKVERGVDRDETVPDGAPLAGPAPAPGPAAAAATAEAARRVQAQAEMRRLLMAD
jgi:hypothetical protein